MSSASDLAEPQLNATPLIDVLLVLLVMLIFTLPVATQITRLNLPRGEPGKPPAAVNLEILYHGEIYWNGEHVDSIEQLTQSRRCTGIRIRPAVHQLRLTSARKALIGACEDGTFFMKSAIR